VADSTSPIEILNVSYDPTRELYQQYNQAFARYWQGATGQPVTIKASHGGSGSQARAVIDGLDADIVTLALEFDVDAVRKAGLIAEANWTSKLPSNSAPYTSTITFLVRKGTPKGIKEWADLAKPGVGVITPNPKTSGGARWNYLAAWGSVIKTGGTPEQAKALVEGIFKNVQVLDSGARGSTTTFVERGIGDVLISWENEAFLAIKELGPDKFEQVYPSWSILAEPSVAVVDKVVDRRKSRAVAENYLRYLYSDEGQQIAGRNYYRPRNEAVANQFSSQFPKINLFPIADFGGWEAAQRAHFDDGATFDQIFKL
jgi:sulfate transport system substrate-binding protein